MRNAQRIPFRLQDSTLGFFRRLVGVVSCPPLNGVIGVTSLLVLCTLNVSLQANPAMGDGKGSLKTSVESSENSGANNDALEHLEWMKVAFEKGNPNDADLRSDLGRAYQMAGLHKEALDQYLWSFDEGPKHAINSSYSAVRISFLLSYIHELAKVYAPAMDALVDRRDALYQAILNNTSDYVSNRREIDDDFAALAQYTDDDDFILSVFDHLEGDRTANRARTLGVFVSRNLETFDQHELFEVIVKHVDMRHEVNSSIASYKRLNGFLDWKLRESHREALAKSVDNFYRKHISNLYKILLATNNQEDATYVEGKLVDLLDEAATYHALASAGIESGRPLKGNVGQARKALGFEPNNATFANTLIHLLHTTGNTSEATVIAKDFLTRELTAEDRSSIERTLHNLH